MLLELSRLGLFKTVLKRLLLNLVVQFKTSVILFYSFRIVIKVRAGRFERLLVYRIKLELLPTRLLGLVVERLPKIRVDVGLDQRRGVCKGLLLLDDLKLFPVARPVQHESFNVAYKYSMPKLCITLVY